MKRKYLASIAACMVIQFAATSQNTPILTEYAVYDNFSTTDEFVSDATTQRGVFWWHETNVSSMVRNPDSTRLDIKMVQNQGMYTPFGVSFGDSNGAELGGDPYTIDLSGNGTFSFDIINKGTQGLSIRVACQDVNNRLVDCDLGATVFGDVWKYQIQVEVPVGDTLRFEAGVPNNAGAGVINTCDFTKGIWGDYGTHTIRTDFDLKHIRGINITVLNAEKKASDGHNVALTDGLFSIANFKVGDTSSNAIAIPVPTISISKSSAILADTAKSIDSVEILSFTNVWLAKSNASWLTVKWDTVSGAGHIILTALANTTTADRNAIITLSSKYGAIETIDVTQSASQSTKISEIKNQQYRIDGHTIFFFSCDVEIYNLLGIMVGDSRNQSIVLQSGEYIIKTSDGSDIIQIK